MLQEPIYSGLAESNMSGFREKFSSTVCSVDCNAAVEGRPVSVHFDGTRLGEIDVLHFESAGMRGGFRSFQHLSTDHIDDIILLLPLSAPIEMSHAGMRSMIEPGNCVFISTLKPFEAICGEPPYHNYSEYIVRIPGSLLRQHAPYIDECCGLSIKVQRGAGRIMKSLVEVLISEGHALSNVQSARLSMALTNVVATYAIEAPEVIKKLEMPPRQLAYALVRECAKEYIGHNLSNPLLDASRISTHCRISRSHLHAAFAAESTSVGSYVRETRLQHCRKALQNPLLRHQSIIQIAMKWGFNSSSSFCRAYQLQFGKAPSEDRKQPPNLS